MTDQEIMGTKKVLNKKAGESKPHEEEVKEEFIIIPYEVDLSDFKYLCNILAKKYFLDELLFIDIDNHPYTPTIASYDEKNGFQPVDKVYISRHKEFTIPNFSTNLLSLDDDENKKINLDKEYYISFYSPENHSYITSFNIIGLRFESKTLEAYHQQYQSTPGMMMDKKFVDYAVKISIFFENDMGEDISFSSQENNKNLHISCGKRYGTDLVDYYIYTMLGSGAGQRHHFSSSDLTLVIEGDSESIGQFDIKYNDQSISPVFNNSTGQGSISLRLGDGLFFVKPNKELDVTCRWMVPDNKGQMMNLVTHQVRFAPALIMKD